MTEGGENSSRDDSRRGTNAVDLTQVVVPLTSIQVDKKQITYDNGKMKANKIN